MQVLRYHSKELQAGTWSMASACAIHMILTKVCLRVSLHLHSLLGANVDKALSTLASRTNKVVHLPNCFMTRAQQAGIPALAGLLALNSLSLTPLQLLSS